MTASVEAGMKIRSLAETTRSWVAASAEPPKLRASLSREKEAAVLAAWHAR